MPGRRGWVAIGSTIGAHWPWALLAIVTVPVLWEVGHYPKGPDPEFPGVDRPTFSPYPPSAYRLAEPGDSLDRVGLYLGATATALSLFGLLRAVARGDRVGPWLAAAAVGLGFSWESASPWPTFDGWHGWNWRVVADTTAPATVRVALGVAATALVAVAVVPAVGLVARPGEAIRRARRAGVLSIAVVAGAMLLAGAAGWPDFGPDGYGSKWARDGGLLLMACGLWRCRPPRPSGAARRALPPLAAGATLAAVIATGLHVLWLHRPLERLRAIEPGRIFISAMPTPDGLDVAHRRHGFKTIINLFQEDLPGLRSPLLDDELAFAERHGIRYVGSPLGASVAEAFLDETLGLAQDPDAWPILVHCHGCMDRTPAWWGVYDFVVRGRPLLDIMRQIEQHRGSRPKGSVTLLYNRVLADRAPDRFDADPTAAVLRRSAEGVRDPFFDHFEAELEEQRRLARTPGDGEGSTGRR